MPARVDHAARRALLADAVWRVVLRDGVKGASVRAVAREAGLSMGSVRHFFATQDELLQFAMTEVITRARSRIRAGAGARSAVAERGDPAEAAAQLLEQVLPLDDDRLVEARVWAAFAGQTATDPGLAAVRKQADDAVYRLCRDCLRAPGLMHHSRDLRVETERLWSLLDGLTMHRLVDARRTSNRRIKAVLRRHLADLASPPACAPG
jgi:AcrR family transcriptional regulator